MIVMDERIFDWTLRISKKKDVFYRAVDKVKLHGHEYYVDEDGDFFKLGENNKCIYYWLDECGAVAYDLLLDVHDVFYGSRKVVYLYDESGNEYWKDDNGKRHYTREEG